jgi:hypothetical protein
MDDDEEKDLFGNPIPPKKGAYARNTDPDPSQDAARRAAFWVQKLEADVLRALKENGTWMTSLAIAAAVGQDKWSISPRMKPLEEKGFVERRKMAGLNSTGNIRDLTHWRRIKRRSNR